MKNKSNIKLITIYIFLILVLIGCSNYLANRKSQIYKKELNSRVNDKSGDTLEPYVDFEQMEKNLVYPKDAKENGIEGRVVLRVLIDVDGKVRKFMIEESTNDIFNQSAIDAVKKTKFLPAYLNSKPIMCWISIPIMYRLN